MNTVEIKPQIFWVGAKDWNLREFHGYKTQKGTTYNSYLIIDEKITLVDTVKSAHFEQMLSRIKTIIDPSRIDYIICNHAEMDHAGAILKISELAPNAEIIASPHGEKYLNSYFFGSTLNIRTVSSGEILRTGKRSFHFIHTPLVHWPDSMVSYLPEEKLLFSNDSFGQHYTSEALFTSQAPREVYLYEAKKYFANIIYPYTKQALKAISAIEPLEIGMIAPSHGLIWDKNSDDIIRKYKDWGLAKNVNKALIVYDTMWGSTEKLAFSAAAAFEENSIPVAVRSLNHEHYSDIVTEVLDSKYVLIGTSVLNGEVLPSAGAFLTYLKGLKPKQKNGFVFGSYGWTKNALVQVDALLRTLGWNMPREPFLQKLLPSPQDCVELKENVRCLIDQKQESGLD